MNATYDVLLRHLLAQYGCVMRVVDIAHAIGISSTALHQRCARHDGYLPRSCDSLARGHWPTHVIAAWLAACGSTSTHPQMLAESTPNTPIRSRRPGRPRRVTTHAGGEA